MLVQFIKSTSMEYNIIKDNMILHEKIISGVFVTFF